MGELTYTLQVSPANLEWKYSEGDSEYRIDQYVIKGDSDQTDNPKYII